MAAAHPRIQIIAFQAPVVEGGVVAWPVHTDAGLRVLTGAVGVFEAALQALVHPPKAGPITGKRKLRLIIAPADRAPVLKPKGAIL